MVDVITHTFHTMRTIDFDQDGLPIEGQVSHDEYEILFSEEERIAMTSPDAEVAKRALFLAGVNLANYPGLLKESNATITSLVLDTCWRNDLRPAIFQAGPIIQGYEFGAKVAEVKSQFPGLLIDDIT